MTATTQTTSDLSKQISFYESSIELHGKPLKYIQVKDTQDIQKYLHNKSVKG